MTITETTRNIVSDGLRKSGMSKKELAAKLGFNPGWITKFFDGKLKTLTEENAIVIEKALGVKFSRIVSKSDKIPGAAQELGKLMETRPELITIANALISITALGQVPHQRHIVKFDPVASDLPSGLEVHRIAGPESAGGEPAFLGEFFHDGERHVGVGGPVVAVAVGGWP